MVVGLMALSSCGAEPEAAVREEKEPFKAPAIVGTYVYGESPFEYDYEGSYTVVNFLNPYCLGSELEAKSLQQFSEENPDIRVIGVIGPSYTRKEAMAFSSRNGWTFSLVHDATHETKTFPLKDGTVHEYRIGTTDYSFDPDMVFPTSFIINKEGMVVGTIVNYIDWQSTEVQDIFEHLRNGKLIWYERYYSRMK